MLKKILSSLFVLALLLTSFPLPASAVSSHIWSSSEDFSLGTETNIQSGEDVTLETVAGVTDTTKTEFDNGAIGKVEGFNSVNITEEDDGEVSLIKQSGGLYNSSSLDGLYWTKGIHSTMDPNTGLLYFTGGYPGGTTVVDRQNTVDLTDDTVVARYGDSGYTPNIETQGNAFQTFLDTDRNLVYQGTYGGGLYVISNQGTQTPNDDVLVMNYTEDSTPSIPGHVYYSLIDQENNTLYVSSAWGAGGTGGVTAINTQGTVSPLDDTLITRYTNTSTPAIPTNDVMHISYNSVHHLLYVNAWGGGLSVINTQGTVDPSDDTLVTTYTTSSTPAILHNNSIFSSIVNNLVYIGTEGGLSVINTQGTVDPSDDTLVTTYTTSSTPAIGGNNVRDVFVDGDILYISTYGGGLSVIDTQGTLDASDDELVKTYTSITNPSVATDYVESSFVDETNRLLYVSSSGGFSVIDINEDYNAAGSYLSRARSISAVSTGILAIDKIQSNEHSISVRYRTGESDAVWRNDFDDNNTSEYVGDFYEWGEPFIDAVENDGTMKLSNPMTHTSGQNQWVDFWFDTGKADEYFPAGSTVTARVKINSQRLQQSYLDYMFNDDWWDDSGGSFVSNEWQIMQFTNYNAFSKIGFDINWRTGTWDDENDNFEIDWLRIEVPESLNYWSDWSDACTDTACAIDPADLTDKEWIQYRLNLATTDPTTTPSVNSVTFSDGYTSTGTFTSEEITFSGTNDLVSFASDTTEPTGTSIAFEYTIDGGTTWTAIDPDYTFPAGVQGSTFQWRATLSTTDPLVTPVIHSVTLSSTEAVISSDEDEPEKASISSWKAFLSEKTGVSCTQRLELEIKGKNFNKNAEVKIGGQKAFEVNRKGNKELTAKFCMKKLLDVKTDLKRFVSVTNPDAEIEKAKKKIDLSLYIAPAKSTVQKTSRPSSLVTSTIQSSVPEDLNEKYRAASTVQSPRVQVEQKASAQAQVPASEVASPTSGFTWWNPLTWWER